MKYKKATLRKLIPFIKKKQTHAACYISIFLLIRTPPIHCSAIHVIAPSY